MKILLVHDHCAKGGHTSFMMELSKGLRAAGHEVRSFFFEDRGFFDIYASQCSAAVGDADAFIKLLAENSFAVIHGDSCMLDLPGLVQRAQFPGRVIITRHSWNAPAGWHRGNCHEYVAVSLSSVTEMQPYTDRAVVCIPNGIDTEFFRPVEVGESSVPIIGWCGRSRDPQKDFGRYLEITRHLADSPLRFEVADGNLSPDAAGPAGEAFAAAAAHIYDWRGYTRAELRLFFNRIARSGGCLLWTAVWEGLPMALLEALACGCPVVAVDAPGVRDVLTGDCKSWLLPEDIAGRDAARFLLETIHAERWQQARAVARRHIENNFSLEAMVIDYLGLYRDDLPASQRPVSPPLELGTVAAHLWQFAEATANGNGRPRDALFAMRAALSICPQSSVNPSRLRLLLQMAQASRLPGARRMLSSACAAFKDRRYRSALTHLVHAVKLHPGVVFQRI